MQNIEIIINYDETMPFNIEQIAVSFELGRDYIMYDVFKCFFFAKTIEEAKYKALIVAIQVYKSRRKNGMKNDYSDVLKIMDSVFPNNIPVDMSSFAKSASNKKRKTFCGPSAF